ncbi:chorismate synthase [Bremerella cremea]|uniref:Chorismate synthase n=1 Tax=Blastopirellula marina TaxID=124 RepID=A0A2S8FUU3_9BACT|nr:MULTISPECIES: chorismate synthase [Pirellulaceae]PQO35948.1 chorismate synthase [Blastopirellula marina]RCS48625.1 chorismate synthase [Bremerella cremea]
MLRYWTAGESHGKTLLAMIDGFPAGLTIDEEPINRELARRQGGYGRGGRQRIETDKVDVMTGVWKGMTLGSPIALQVINRDYKLERLEDLPRPRPGHGDLTGAIKFLGPIRAILERASARETAVRVAAGALAKQLLAEFDIKVYGFVDELGGVAIERPENVDDVEAMVAKRDESIIYSLNPAQDPAFKELIDKTGKAGDTLGGIVEVRVVGAPFGLGTHAQWERKLDGKLAQAVMAVQAIKGVEIGMGFEAARLPGSQVHDPIHYDPMQQESVNLGYTRPTNNAGGLEAGMTNGQTIVVRAAKKPISTLRKPLESVNLETKETDAASYERSDVCAVSAASVIVESVVAFEIAVALVDKFGGDSLEEMKARYQLFLDMARKR